jgi:formate transporter
MEKFNGHSTREIGMLCTHAGIAKGEFHWFEMGVKSLLSGKFAFSTDCVRMFNLIVLGVFAGMGGLFSIIVTGGAVGLRESNSSIATLLGALVFCLGFVLIIITNNELATANMFVMVYTTLQRKTSVVAMARVLVERWIQYQRSSPDPC